MEKYAAIPIAGRFSGQIATKQMEGLKWISGRLGYIPYNFNFTFFPPLLAPWFHQAQVGDLQRRFESVIQTGLAHVVFCKGHCRLDSFHVGFREPSWNNKLVE